LLYYLSAFKFENYLQFVKKSLKNTTFPLQDIYNHTIDHRELQIQSVIKNCYPILNNEIFNYDTFYAYSPFITYYEQIITNKFLICSINLKNGHFILIDNSIVVVKKILKYSNDQIEIGVVKYNSYSVMSNTPMESNVVGSFYVSTTDISDLFFVKLKYIKNKCFFCYYT